LVRREGFSLLLIIIPVAETFQLKALGTHASSALMGSAYSPANLRQNSVMVWDDDGKTGQQRSVYRYEQYVCTSTVCERG
jgi:hypothetical protein